VFSSVDPNRIVRAVGSTLRVWVLFAFGVGAASGLAIGLDRLGANDAVRFALPLCLLIALFGAYVLGAGTVLRDVGQSVASKMIAVSADLWAVHILAEAVPGTAAVFGLSVAVGFTVLFALLDMPEGGRAVGLAASAAVGVGSCIQLARGAIVLVSEVTMRQATTADRLPKDVDWVYASRVEAQSDIAEALVQQADSGAGALIMCAVAGRDILQFGGWSYKGASLFSVLNGKLHGRENAVQWDIMLLDPESAEADRRERYEETGRTVAEIQDSIQTCQTQFARLRGRVRCWLYPNRPFVFAVVTEDVAFEQRLLSAPRSLPFRGRYGDLTPVLRYRVGSRYYLQLRAELVNFRDSDCRVV